MLPAALPAATGTATFAGRLSAGDVGGSVNAPVGLPAYGLLDPYGAEIQFLFTTTVRNCRRSCPP